MRVAFNTIPDLLVAQLSKLGAQQVSLQNQAATGRRISQLEDDPAAMGRVFSLQTQASQLGQYRRNIASVQDRTAAAYSALQGLQKISTRAGEIATLADGTKSPQELATYAAEVNQLIAQGVQLMNSSHDGDYLFGGTRTDQPPFAVTTDANGLVTAVSYQGNDAVASVEIGPGVTVPLQALGANTSGLGPSGIITDSRSGADFFNHLIALQNHLRAGDTATIASADRPALVKDEDNLALQAGTIGFLRSQLAATDSLAGDQSTSLDQMISQNADADLAQVLTRLSATQAAYQAALQSGASLLNSGQSLMDYLR